MASKALVRISGSVLAVPPARGGLIKNGPRQGEPFSIETANILVADQNVTVVQLPRRDATGVFETLPGVRSVEKGDIVDFLCEMSIYGQEIQARVLQAWPDDDVSSFAA